MLRIALFLLTNLAIVLVASITLSLLGFEGYLASNGVDLNLSSLLVFCFVFGMAGSVISLLLSKTMAKMGTPDGADRTTDLHGRALAGTNRERTGRRGRYRHAAGWDFSLISQ